MPRLATGDIALNFTLPATNGQTYTLREVARDANAVVIVFTCNHCPYAQAWEDHINAIARDYASLGVRILAINSNNALIPPSDSWENMIQRTYEKQFVFPYLYDESQDVARFYGAEHPPEVFIFNAAGSLRYHGAPDDNYEDEQAVRCTIWASILASCHAVPKSLSSVGLMIVGRSTSRILIVSTRCGCGPSIITVHLLALIATSSSPAIPMPTMKRSVRPLSIFAVIRSASASL